MEFCLFKHVLALRNSDLCLTRAWCSTRYFVTQGYLSKFQDLFLKNLTRYFSLGATINMHKNKIKSRTIKHSDDSYGTTTTTKNPDTNGKYLNTINNKERRDSFSNSDKMSVPEHFSEMERQIFVAHKNAIEANNDTYEDPLTGYSVFTQKALLNRRKCCGCACRHCPYDHVNVPEQLRTKKFNSQFYL